MSSRWAPSAAVPTAAIDPAPRTDPAETDPPETDLADATAGDATAQEEFARLEALLRPAMKAIAAANGPHCEVVLHDLTSRDLDHTIAAIENGHVTGRSVGGPSTSLGLELLHDETADHDEYGYRSRTRDGRELRSSSTYFRGADGRVIASLCINVDLTPFQTARAVLDEILNHGAEPPETQEIIAEDINEILDQLIDAAVASTGKSPALMARIDRVEVLRYLDNKGAFHVKRAVDRVARRLGVARVTAYNYLEEIRGGPRQQ